MEKVDADLKKIIDIDNNMPNIEDILLSLPLYKKVDIQEEKLFSFVESLEYFQGALDLYCPQCENNSTFRLEYDHEEYSRITRIRAANAGFVQVGLEINPKSVIKSILHLNFYCTRVITHKIDFIVMIDPNEKTIMKIGQYPSIADLSTVKLNKYKKILDNNYFLELRKAVGLKAHGVGIGSFVYLRRIFEFVIEDVHKAVKEKWDQDKQEQYSKSRIDEKIKLLSEYLPDYLVDNSSTYSILSLGIHELTEENCLSYFDVLEGAIEIILDDQIHKMEEEKKRKRISKELDNIKSKHNTSK